MYKLAYFQFVQDCHTMRRMGYPVKAIAVRLASPVDEVELALESSPVGASPHG